MRCLPLIDSVDLQSPTMGIAIAGLIVTVITLIVSLGFNYFQYQWRKDDKNQRDRERAEA